MNLNQVTVPASDIAASIAFYQILGLRLIVQSPHYARFELPQGEATFSIHQAADLPKGEKTNGIVVYFEIENLDGYAADLQAKGIVFTELPNNKAWLWREAHLYDLDGNHLILFWAGVNRKNPPWRI